MVAHFRPFKVLMFSAIIVIFSVSIAVYIAFSSFNGDLYKNPRDPIIAAMIFILTPVLLRDYLGIGVSVIKNGTRAIYTQSGRMIYLSPAFLADSLMTSLRSHSRPVC